VPTYGYHCPDCDAEFEVLQRMTDPPTADCPRCGTPGRRLFFPTGIVFKGSGFYKTDSRRSTSASVDAAAPAGGRSNGADRPAGEKSPAGAGGTAGEKTPGGGGAAGGGPAPSATSAGAAPAGGSPGA
jgi:putative FmdB family regulatory protein